MGKNPSEMKLGELVDLMIRERIALHVQVTVNGYIPAHDLDRFYEKYKPLVKALNIGKYKKLF
ncbi:MAG: hypothetical protein KKH88_03420 [Nanoarchaeota archaeon]|nr:hypothetical protein [Nanoarchaeota archaeon]